MRKSLLALLLAVPFAGGDAWAQFQAGPPAVGVVKAQPVSVTESTAFVGRVQAIDRVALTARVTAYLQERLFVEGAEVREGDLLYRLERGPFEAAVAQQAGTLSDMKSKLDIATTHLDRAQKLLSTPAGQRANFEDAQATQRSSAAQVAIAQAQLKQAQINLDYTEIKAPVAGKIGRGTITVGNVVSPTSGPLTTIVSQDPMYVTFPVSTRSLTELQRRYADKGGIAAARVRLKLPDGSAFAPIGSIDYVDPTVATTTDTVTVRAKIANPPLRPAEAGKPVDRPLIDGAFVGVSVEGLEPISALGIPRTAVLSDQQGDYVFVVGDGNKAEIRRVTLGQSTPAVATIAAGLKEGDTVIAEGIQRVRPGNPVNPAPITPPAGK